MDKRSFLKTGLAAALLAGTTLLVGTAFATGGGPLVGSPAPNFTATDSNGKTVSLADFKGKTVVLEWTNNGCPFVRKHYQGNMQALQKKYATVRDFSADFVQTYRGGVLNRQMKDTGHVMVRKPGKMRWEYKTPEEKLFVSDGTSIYWYVPQDRQAEKRPMPPDDQASTPALFLAGKGDITRESVTKAMKDLKPLETPMTGMPFAFGGGKEHASNLAAKFVSPDGKGGWKVLTDDWIKLPNA